MCRAGPGEVQEEGREASAGGFAVLCLSLLEKELVPGGHGSRQRIRVSEAIWAASFEARERG